MKSWCKVASNLDSHPKIRRAGRNGREVFLFALRRNAEPDNPVPGRLPGAMLEPWYLADQLMMSEEEAVTGVTACRHAGLLVQDGESWVIGGWDDDWGKKAVEGKDRTAKWREGKKSGNGVTERDVTNVTQSHRDACDALDKTRREEKRSEKKREEREERDLEPPGDHNHVPGAKPPRDPVSPKPDRSEVRASRIPVRAWGAADYFRELVLAEFPTVALRTKRWEGERGARLEWADALRLLVEKDERTWEDLHDTLVWLFKKQTGNARFVVQSPDALREKWDRITANRQPRQGGFDPLMAIAMGGES